MNKTTLFLTILIFILLSANVYAVSQWYIARSEIEHETNVCKVQQTNSAVADFQKMFIQKVVKAQSDVSIEDRLDLENKVRALKNQAIFDQWQKFVQSKTESQAQTEASNLLELLSNSLIY